MGIVDRASSNVRLGGVDRPRSGVTGHCLRLVINGNDEALMLSVSVDKYELVESGIATNFFGVQNLGL